MCSLHVWWQLLACSCRCGHKAKSMSSTLDSRSTSTASSTQKNLVCLTTRSSGRSSSDRNRWRSTSWATYCRRSFPLDASASSWPLIPRDIVSSSGSPVGRTLTTVFLLIAIVYNKIFTQWLLLNILLLIHAGLYLSLMLVLMLCMRNCIILYYQIKSNIWNLLLSIEVVFTTILSIFLFFSVLMLPLRWMNTFIFRQRSRYIDGCIACYLFSSADREHLTERVVVFSAAFV